VPLGSSKQVKATCSGGLALLQPGDPEGSVLLSRADGALYAAKSAGRNRIHAAGRPSSKVARSAFATGEAAALPA
jgi:PleD family two-component response regulator